MPQTRVIPGSTIYSFGETYQSHTVTIMSSSPFLSPSDSSCNGSGNLTIPAAETGGMLNIPGCGGGGGGGSLGGEGGGNLYAAIGRKPTPMLARKNTPDNMTQLSKNMELNVTSFQMDSNKTSRTTTSSSSTSSTIVKLPAVNVTHNNKTHGNLYKVAVQPAPKSGESKKHEITNNNEKSKSRKKNVHFGDAHVVDDSWITDKWLKRGLNFTAIKNGLRKRFRRNRNTVSSDNQCSPEEPTAEETDEKISQKPVVPPPPILKTRGSPNALPSGNSMEFRTTMNSLHNVNANL